MLLQDLKKLELTKCEQTLADYILENPGKVLEMTARELAETCYTSASTTVRLCRKLGFKNYAAFKVCLSKETTDNFLNMSKVDFNMPFSKGATPKELVGNLSELAIASILRCTDSFDYAAAGRIARMLASHRYINLYGVGHSAHSAMEFCEKMSHIGYFTTLYTSAPQQIQSALNSNKEQAAILISYSGETDILLHLAQILKKNQVPMAVLTGNKQSPLLKYASTYHMFIDSEELLQVEEKTDYFGSLYTMHFIFDCLFSMIFNQNYDRNLAREQNAPSASAFSSPRNLPIPNL